LKEITQKKIFLKKENGLICLVLKIKKSSARSTSAGTTPSNIKTRFMKSLK